jgi:hypothetical protein
MANPKQVITGKVQKNPNNRKHFKIQKHNDNELEVEIDIEKDDDYVVEKLSVDGLPATIDDEKGNAIPIRWFNNFSIMKGKEYINQSFKVKIAGLSAVRAAKKNIVLWDGNSNNKKPWVFTGAVIDDTIELTDGDPGIGMSPP